MSCQRSSWDGDKPGRQVVGPIVLGRRCVSATGSQQTPSAPSTGSRQARARSSENRTADQVKNTCSALLFSFHCYITTLLTVHGNLLVLGRPSLASPHPHHHSRTNLTQIKPQHSCLDAKLSNILYLLFLKRYS